MIAPITQLINTPMTNYQNESWKTTIALAFDMENYYKNLPYLL